MAAGTVASVPDRHATRCLRGRKSGVREERSDFSEQVVDTGRKRRCADGDCESDEDDEHGVFDRRGAALVPAKAMDQTEHLRFLLQVECGPMASARR